MSGGADGVGEGPEDAPRVPRGFVVITGLSGSGKSLVQRCFEDMGWFCVDNLPSELIPKLAEVKDRSGPALGRVALTVDVRERHFLAELPRVYQDLKRRDPDVTLLFLEADDATLVKRFSETRRPHPLAGDRPLLEGIAAERELLAPLRAMADTVLDTTDFKGSELRSHLFARFGEPGATRRLQVGVLSFAYRHGVPKEADLVLDVRFLSNPYYVAGLRPLTGRDAPVREYLEGLAEYREFMARLTSLLDLLLPAYEREGKSYLTLAIGCTGGRHRSVAVAEALHARLSGQGLAAMVSHRDCERQP